MDRRRRGAQAERAARRYLEARGLTTLAHNYRSRWGELDLVMRDGSEVVFVEVRFRTGSGFGGAAASVDARKQHKLARTAAAWLQQHAATAATRFDVVCCSGDSAAPHITWLRDAFNVTE